MQTRKFGFRGITLALAGVLTLGLAACEDTETVPEVRPVTISVSPTGTVDLQVGQTFQVVASVQNATNNAVTFTSSNQTVATVDANGTVTARAAGVSTITAASVQDPNAKAAVVVRVTPAPTPPTPPAQPNPSVIIQSMVDANNNPVNTASASGRIFVRLEVDRQNADSLQVRLGNTVVCRQSFTTSSESSTEELNASQAAAEFVCPIETNAVDASGAPRFPNGATTVSARLFRGTTVAAQASTPITLNNTNRLSTSVSTERQALAPATGLQWNDGNVTVTVNPAIFSGGTTVNRVTVSALVDGTVVASKTATGTAPFTVTFRGDSAANLTENGLAGVSTESLRFRVTSVTAAGTQGPDFETAAGSALRYDNAAPTAGTLALPAGSSNWLGGNIGADFALSGASRTNTAGETVELVAGEADVAPGVGGVTTRFVYMANNSDNAALSNAEIVARGTAVSSLSQIPESSSNEAYILVVQTCDALGNCANTNRVTFGVDRTAPTLASGSVSPSTSTGARTNPSTNLVAAPSDTLSGLPANPLIARVTRNAPDLTSEQRCGPVLTTGDNVDLPGGLQDGACVFTRAETGTSITIPQNGVENVGYYNYEVRAMDRAGNISGTVSRVILVDDAPPAITSVTLPTTFPAAGSEFTASVAATDNLDLFLSRNRLVFSPGGTTIRLQFGGDVTIDPRFDSNLRTSANFNVTSTLVRSLTNDENESYDQSVDALRVVVFDASGNARQNSGTPVQDVAIAGVSGSATSPFENLNSSTTIASGQPSTICTDVIGRVCGGTPSSTVVNFDITAPAGTSQPFGSLRVYIGEFFVGTATFTGTPAVVNESTVRYRYTFTVDATAASAFASTLTAANFRAVGVNASGDAFRLRGPDASNQITIQF